MTRAELLALAKRAEAADGADWELDPAIARAVGHPAVDRPGFICPAYTASVDAALMLVPEGWETTIYLGGEKTCVQMETKALRQRDDFFPLEAIAATPAVAIVAASLRALAEEISDE